MGNITGKHNHHKKVVHNSDFLDKANAVNDSVQIQAVDSVLTNIQPQPEKLLPPSERAQRILSDIQNLYQTVDHYPLLVDQIMTMAKSLTLDELNYSHTSGGSLLHSIGLYARGEPSCDVLRQLTLMGLNVNTLDENGRGPLDTTCLAVGSTCSVEAVKILLDAGANINNIGNDSHSVLTRTVHRYTHTVSCPLETIRMLLKYNPDVRHTVKSDHDKTALHMACLDADHELVKLLLDQGAYPNCQDRSGETPLHYMSRYGWNIAMLNHLIDKGAIVDVVNQNNYTPFLLATQTKIENRHMWLKLLITHKADPKKTVNGLNAIHLTLMTSDPDEIKLPLVHLLIQLGVDLFQPDRSGITPYNLMCQKYKKDGSVVCQALSKHQEYMKKQQGIEPVEFSGINENTTDNKPQDSTMMKSQDGDICAICLEILPKNKWMTPCGHQFCGGCFSKNVKEFGKDTCPMCRANLGLVK